MGSQDQASGADGGGWSMSLLFFNPYLSGCRVATMLLKVLGPTMVGVVNVSSSTFQPRALSCRKVTMPALAAPSSPAGLCAAWQQHGQGCQAAWDGAGDPEVAGGGGGTNL